ncbi:MAG: electron transfer flavoprotein subunit beta/FixA family protein [Candidatus Marinimicrobia bacterium]|nr:electron transfer flavoprotein subunit beta/FixA family protein [Candidatus Neomarinimicrobiota bacterium]
MNIIVLVKQVPDTEAKIRIADDGNQIDEASISFIVNPYDEYAIEAALQLKEAHGGEITLVSLGPGGAIAALRTGLAMGADKAVLLKAENSRFMNSQAVAGQIGKVLADRQFDLVLCGKKAVDTDAQQIGTLLAMNLEISVISSIVELNIAGNQITAKREVEGGTETVSCQLPAVLTCEKGLNEPRYPNLRGIMMAKKKPIEEIVVDVVDSVTDFKFENPPQKAEGRIVGEGVDAVPELARLLREEAKVI